MGSRSVERTGDHEIKCTDTVSIRIADLQVGTYSVVGPVILKMGTLEPWEMRIEDEGTVRVGYGLAQFSSPDTLCIQGGGYAIPLTMVMLDSISVYRSVLQST